MREEQAVVAEFVHAHGLETDGWVRFLDLVSELGELSKELLKVSDYGKLPLTATDAMKDELGDCMFPCCACAACLNWTQRMRWTGRLQSMNGVSPSTGRRGSVTLHPSRGDCGVTPLCFGEGWSPHHGIFSCSRLFMPTVFACPR